MRLRDECGGIGETHRAAQQLDDLDVQQPPVQIEVDIVQVHLHPALPPPFERRVGAHAHTRRVCDELVVDLHPGGVDAVCGQQRRVTGEIGGGKAERSASSVACDDQPGESAGEPSAHA